MKAAELRQSILQAAVRGKLMPQNPEDEPASVLLERVKQKKNQFLKKNGIKDEKPLPRIATDEYPYVLPQGWIWCRLGDLGVVQSSKRVFTSDFVNQGIPFYRGTEVGALSTGKSVIPKYYITEEHYTELVHHTGKPMVGDLLMPSICPDGRIWQVDTDAPFYFKDGRVLWIRFPEDSINNHYVQQALRARLLSDYKGIASGTTFAELKIFLLREIVIALPPLAEQNRIVTKINGLFALCDELEAEEKKLDVLEARFTEYLPKSILQEAVRGKLVPQDAQDEPASELLKRIQQEKAQLIKEGKIKEEKPLPPVAADEIPFDLPEGWTWCRTAEICTYIQRGRSPVYSDIQVFPVIAQKCVQWTGLDIKKALFIDPDTLPKYEKIRILKTNDLLWNSTGKGTLGRITIYDEKANPYKLAVADSHITVLRPIKVLSKYLFYWFAGADVQNTLEEKATGSTKQIELATSTIKSYLIPLPPLAEQHRIVAKIEELLVLCDELKVAYIEPVEFDKVAEIIPFPVPVTIEQREESAEPLLLAARGDVENLSSEALKAIDDLFAEDTE